MQRAIIILNYKTPQLVIDCLQSLVVEVDPVSHRVIVVDNASNDGSVEEIQGAIANNNWSTWAEVLPSDVNGGFSAGNNIGMKAVEAEAYLLLNSDTIVRPGAIATLLETMQAHPDAGLISPRLEWPDATPQISCFRYQSPVSEFIGSADTGFLTSLLNAFHVPLPVAEHPCEPEWTSFACVLIRKDVIDQVGLMDEGYFMYYDDIDYCRQARNAGWKIRHNPAARVVHLRGGSGSVKADMASRKRPRPYLYASRSRYFAKYYGPFGLLIANSMWLLGRSISFCRELLGKEASPHICEHMAQDIWMNWLNPLKPALIPGKGNQ
ncbi:glycosyltransferase family 2 protein [Okeania sp. SIO2G5]|uniref:glycosyltransferase family 2 protein n=1 Tax=Okeania sp. SIO2G5 TaxID=2607796 RepID=UPI0013C14650|nr:glycosyltransferase family 2 protein [Okeania sp. SIO2G5]NEP76368.1 glycosyltransferase family 2 protein [Okeania sp. SIO2G5]